MTQKKLYKNRPLMAALLILIVITLAITYFAKHKKLLIAPMIGGLDACIFHKQYLLSNTPDAKYTKLCLADGDSPSQLIETTLRNISENKNGTGNYKLGYTLYIPLLMLFESKGSDIQINMSIVRRIAKTVENVDRPVILYLFSNHFGVGGQVEQILAQNPDNLLQTVKGGMKKDSYYNVNIFPWSFVTTDNEITRLRERAFNAVLDEVCKLPKNIVARVEGVTMLGELHHMFPNFQAGMGFSGDYLISDYSKHSSDGFRNYLSGKYKLVAALNKQLGSDYSSFEAIPPPSKNIRTDTLKNYWEHIDAYAHGTLPIAGWVAKSQRNPAAEDWVQIYANGKLIARTAVAFGRQDVLAAHPEISSADVGWSYDLDYSKMVPGLHRIDILLERGVEPLMLLASRQIAIMERSQATPMAVASTELPLTVPANASALFHVDSPGDLSSYYYNPLVTLWHGFRKHQIAEYLNHFGNIAKNKCINPNLIYSHQILPFVNPGWDENKYAVGRDLAVPGDMRLGISLYGEASYGTSFFDWFKGTRRSSYGITEFHPLKPMDAKALESVFNQHFQNNAQFLSFFVEGFGLNEDPENRPNLFSFDLKNNNAGSDTLYKSVREVLK
jgi:hypothetical protein